MIQGRPGVGHLAFDNPAIYRVLVSGHVSANWSDRMEGMSIWWLANADEPVITVLEGELIDQAALVGVLKTLYDLHLAVLTVECLRASQRHA